VSPAAGPERTVHVRRLPRRLRAWLLDVAANVAVVCMVTAFIKTLDWLVFDFGWRVLGVAVIVAVIDWLLELADNLLDELVRVARRAHASVRGRWHR
jgi:uncharacterized RDD family membrane protein YckC